VLRAVRIELAPPCAPVWIRICTQIRAPSSKRSIAGEIAEGRYAVIGDTVRVGFAMIGALLLMLLLRSRPQLRPLQDYLQRGQIDTADDGAQGSYGPTQHHFTDVRITPPSARGRAFNSLDAQRDACEAYIKSQAHEGWRLIRAIDGAIY
jgi:hypothetical protein